MAMKILHTTLKYNIPIRQVGLTGNLASDRALPYIQSLVAGRFVALDNTGCAVLADNAIAGQIVIGCLVNSAAGNEYENAASLASFKIAVLGGPGAVFSTDQVAPSITIQPGEALYVGTGATAGLLTNVSPGATAQRVGVAISASSPASPEVTLILGK